MFPVPRRRAAVRARTAAAGLAAAFGLAMIWIVALAVAAVVVGFIVLRVLLPFKYSGAW